MVPRSNDCAIKSGSAVSLHFMSYSLRKKVCPGRNWSQRMSLPPLDATVATTQSKTRDRVLSLIAAFIVVAIITVARY